MRIGIDCRLSGLAHAGIGRYIENLIVRLPQQAPDIDWVFFFHDSQQIPAALNGEIVLVPIRHYSLSEQLKLPIIFRRANLDLLHVPHFNVPYFYSGKLVVTIHDLLWHEQRGSQVTTLNPWTYWLKYAAYRQVAKRAAQRADQIIVPAQTIKNTLAKYYPFTAAKTNVTYEGVDDRLVTHRQSSVKKLPQRLIYVGSLYPHKNVSLIIDALRQLPDWELLIVGARNIFQENIKKLVVQYQLSERVSFAGYLPDDKLAQEIQRAAVLVQPSLSEGFGLTGIEALALQTPVLASNIPIFKEIYGEAAIYFDPHSVDSFINSLSHVRSFDRGSAQQVVAKYSWDEMTAHTIEIYRQAIKSSSSKIIPE